MRFAPLCRQTAAAEAPPQRQPIENREVRVRFTSSLTRAVQTRFDFPGTIYGTRQRTWGEIGTRVARAAAALQSFGIARGDRVALLALNSDNYLEMLYAIAWAGAVSVPLNTRWAQEELDYALRDCAAGLLFIDENYLTEARALQQSLGLRALIWMGNGPAPEGTQDIEDLIAAHPPMEDHCGSGDDLCTICYTGGTTGRSRGVMLSNTNLVCGMVNWIASLHFSDEIIFMHSAGFFHLAGTIPAFALTMAGGTNVCLPKFDAELALATIERHRVNYCLLVPTMVSMLLNHPKSAEYDLSSLRYIEYGASPISDTVLAAAMKRLPDCTFMQGYGMTECAALAMSVPWRYHFDRPDGPSKRLATGRISYGMEVRIIDSDGRTLPAGLPGEIALRGPQIMLGYLNQPEATAAAFVDGWYRTGDGGVMDSDGFVTLTDRVKDMIISGGENVYSKEVENAIFAHPAVRDVAVIGIPSVEWGEAVHAVVVLQPGKSLTLAELVAFCRSRISGYKLPRSIEFLPELPLSAAGKVVKAELRQKWWQGKSRTIA